MAKTNNIVGRSGSALLALLMIALLVGGCGSEATGADAASAGGNTANKVAPRVGYIAPDFALPDLDGKPIRHNDFRGQPVFINFWTTWCKACKEEMPFIEAAWKDHQQHGVAILGVDVQESPDTVKNFVTQGGYDWTFLLDSGGEVYSNQYNGNAFPTSVFIDTEGVIRGIRIGGMTRDIIESRLNLIKNW